MRSPIFSRAWRIMPIVLGVGVPLAGCKAQSIPSTWLSDCVGRMQISLPEVADVAAVTPEAVIESDTSGNLPSSYFSDGKGAPYSSIGYFGPVEATAPLTDKQISSLAPAWWRKRHTSRSNTKQRGNRVHRPVSPCCLHQVGMAWYGILVRVFVDACLSGGSTTHGVSA